MEFLLDSVGASKPETPVLTEYHHNAQGAIRRLMQDQAGEALAALHHPDVGDIDLVWGVAGTGSSDGHGLAKLVKFHPEVLKDLQPLAVRFVVTEDDKGHYHYDHTIHQQDAVMDSIDQEKSPDLSGLDSATTSNARGVTDKSARPIRLVGCQLEDSLGIHDGNVNTSELVLDSSSGDDDWVLNLFIEKVQTEKTPSEPVDPVPVLDSVDSPIERIRKEKEIFDGLRMNLV